MPIELIDKIKPKNNGDFKLVDAEDVGFEDGKSLPEKIEEVKDAIKDITGTEGEVNTIEGAIVKSKEYTDTKITEVNEKITTATNNIASLDERVVETESHVVNKNNPHSVTAAQVGAYNKTEVENLINTLKNQLLGGAGDAFDTLKELADALGNDPNFATTIANQIAGKYTKPSAGIPKTDLASAVQTSLNKADSAVQEETDPTVPSWAKQANKPSYTPDEIGAQEKLTSGTNIKTVNNQSLLGEGNIEIKTDLSNYYNKGEVDSKLGGKANSNHTHDIGNIVDLQTKLDSISENAEQALNNYLPLSGGTLTDRLNIKGNNENGVLRIHYGSNPNEASIGFFKDNVCKKTFGISHQINDELGYYDNAGDNTWHVLASQDWVNGNYLPLSGGIMTGQLNFQSMGDCHIKAGNGDGASLETQNLRISSWWGIGFYDTNGQKCSIVFDTRNGNAIFTGSLNVNSNQKVATESWAINIFNQKTDSSDFNAHTGNKSNPHNVTASQIGAVTESWVNGKIAKKIWEGKSNNIESLNLNVGDLIICKIWFNRYSASNTYYAWGIAEIENSETEFPILMTSSGSSSVVVLGSTFYASASRIRINTGNFLNYGIIKYNGSVEGKQLSTNNSIEIRSIYKLC